MSHPGQVQCGGCRNSFPSLRGGTRR
ncbi:MAG TPA: hypothetical protein DDX92_00565 [Flavobacteriales bacterium]|nr:hypothetical protein [Flavobacteriales bacterium]